MPSEEVEKNDTQMIKEEPEQPPSMAYNQVESMPMPSQGENGFGPQAQNATQSVEMGHSPEYDESQQMSGRMNDQGFPATVGIKEDG